MGRKTLLDNFIWGNEIIEKPFPTPFFPRYVIDIDDKSTFDICHRVTGTLYRFKVDRPSTVKRWVEAIGQAIVVT